MRILPRGFRSCPPSPWVAVSQGLCLVVLVCGQGALRAKGVAVGALERSLPGVDPGLVLLGELNCIACHAPDASAEHHILPRLSPRLGSNGLALTPQGLRAFLTDPQGEKPGTPMPDLLHGIRDRPGTVDALVHFLSSLQVATTEPPVGANDFTLQRGKSLYHQLGCVACHEPQEPSRPNEEIPPSSRPETIAPLHSSSIPLGHLARKTTVADLTHFLMDPLRSRPSGRMPSFHLTKGEATAIAVYLLRQQAGLADPARPPVRIKGLQYDYFEERFTSAAQLDQATPSATGVTPQFKTDNRKRNENFGFRFTGSITIATEGEYTFFTHSDDGSILSIDGEKLVDNDGDHGGTEKSGTLHMVPGPHAIRVAYYNSGGPFELRVSYQGPGIQKTEIPESVLTHFGRPMIPLDAEELVLDPVKVAHGRSLFGSLGCAACHRTDDPAIASTKASPLRQLNAAQVGGCLNTPEPGRPQYALDDLQAAALQTTLNKGFAVTPDPAQQIRHTMAALNCYACHSRDGAGGPERPRAEYFTSHDNVDLGDEGRLPPHLTGVGAKLKPEWLLDVLKGRATARPYMATRMPSFGEENAAALAPLFVRADFESLETLPVIPTVDAKQGRKLVGTGGLSCITCHTFDQYASLGVPAMDLTLMGKRLRPDWFRRYLLDPASLRPGTRMPSFWPERQAANQDILDDNSEAQIQSIWAFLEKGVTGGLPPGLIQGKEEISAREEAVIYRHFIAGAGSRAIGVGYPEKANLAFDANGIRLALIWQGAFIDAAKHRSGRGAGSEQPLGYNVLRMPPGPPFALLSSPHTPWPETDGKEAGYRMHGYRLDDRRRPAFLYSFGDIRIEDYPIDKPGELDGNFQRTLTMRSAAAPAELWFRAWVGRKVDPIGNNAFEVDDHLTIRFDANATPTVRRVGDRSELIVLIRFIDGQATLTQELIW